MISGMQKLCVCVKGYGHVPCEMTPCINSMKI